MNSSYQRPSFTHIGSLRAVTAAASGPFDSDARLKKDVEPYDAVLPRLKELSSPADADDLSVDRSFEKPVVLLQGSLRNVTAAASEAISDARLKKDVEPYDSVLPRLNKLT